MNVSVGSKLKAVRQTVGQLANQLEALSPLRVLGRGYSLTHLNDEQQLVRSVEDVAAGDELLTRLADGRIISQVLDTKSGTK